MDLAWEAILAASTVFFLGAISPGPSLLMVIRNTIVGGRRRGVLCAVGHGIGFGLYAGVAIFGLIVLLEEAPRGLPWTAMDWNCSSYLLRLVDVGTQ